MPETNLNMNPISLRRASVICAFLAIALSRLSAAYEPAIVGADARWVIHADFNALRTSTLGKELVTAVETAQREATKGTIGIDISKLLATIGSLTAYGTNLLADPKTIDGALIAQGTANLRKIAESLLLQGTIAQPKVFSEVQDLPFPAYGISNANEKTAEKLQVIVAFPPEPIVIVSKSRTQLIKARDVFRGAAPSIAKMPESPLNARNAVGAYLYAATIVPSEPIFPQNAPQTRILQLAHSGAISIGERGADTFAHAELLASADANAEKLMKILQGMTSMLALAETNDRQLAEFIESTSVTREKKTVTLDLAYSSARLVQMAQALHTQAEIKPAQQRQQLISMGRIVAAWGGEAAPNNSATVAGALALRTIDSVPLRNGTLVTLGRALNGGKNARFDRVEIVPAAGGSALVFRSDFMRAVRGTMLQFPFPGADGTYQFKVTYVEDPDGKAKYAVSINDPKPPAEAPEPAGNTPEPKRNR